MDQETHVLAFDVGTTGCKTCLYRIGETLTQVASEVAEYPLYVTEDGGAEQRVEEWWDALCQSTRSVLSKGGVPPSGIRGISFCCQMQGSVVVDRHGDALRNPMVYLDGRATEQIDRYLRRGLFRISGINAFALLNTLRITGGVAATAKDPLWKYHWVKDHEPDLFTRVHKWLDVKDYLILRCTGECAMTPDSAHITFVYDTRRGKEGWHPGLCRTFGVDMAHLPKVVGATDVVGGLSERAARELGLCSGTPVFGGGGDVTLTTIGSGCLDLYDTHIYVGTSGWVVSNVGKRYVDIAHFMAAILGAIPGHYNYVAEQETSGACLQWVRDHLAVDAIGVYLKEKGMDAESVDPAELYALMNRAVDETPPGAGNLLFTPWLHGNRAPKEDTRARGIFFNIGMNTGKRQMIRAVLEGVAFHKRWMLEAMESRIPKQETVRFVGGGARSEVWCQIMSDVTGRRIEAVSQPQDSGAAGAAVVCAVGLGIMPSFSAAKPLIKVAKTYEPQVELKPMYDRQFKVFKTLYKKNRTLFKTLN
ncbi:xylulokinase [Desulfoluna spongiiphila]|uniref:xylulokinase n=1 Tax=Desulfoluna spongiiphila TaxID=419481 RepID=UPI001259FBCC|nr:FGGY-family carbohydrate kinase [Desulfoluna spongiiphila]VVS94756.1 carbohydrate kinase fggy [Desulfoluna spongiiphila]